MSSSAEGTGATTPSGSSTPAESVLVLGGEGMLGSMVAGELARRPGLRVTVTARDTAAVERSRRRLASVDWHPFDAATGDLEAHADLLRASAWVINCIGILKPLIRDDDAFEVERAVRVNALFPMHLARATEGYARVLQIATDCVYSGLRGNHGEADLHDPLDVYGKSKSLGEVRAAHVHHLRCSIVGPEVKPPKSLLEWLFRQPRGASLNGFTNHLWNGITTLHFARLCAGILNSQSELPHLQHVVPRGTVTKCELLQQLADQMGRRDLAVRPAAAPLAVDRTLITSDERLNRDLWAAAGYAQPPSVPEMIAELVRSDDRLVRSAAGEPQLA